MNRPSRYDRKQLAEEWVRVKGECSTVAALLIECGALIRANRKVPEEQGLQFIDQVVVAVEDAEGPSDLRRPGDLFDCFKPAHAGADMPTPEEAESCVQAWLRAPGP